ncbi:hypothetical protein COCMIDRAFT_22133 [Bipolaris oryzae ATCC 44560]|uniref:Uncharacterized protein n=1 Tax=Bipolaris oryzae ATCC 44560 TaxID=930090 RepID=W6ZEK6_COCMI|nr:uncharacterized protein COCMIDRAFT_22133 [Bipolaris oryzae ATCC 44560]EUC50252.1 hypothetical protein COCMIDRAFT_22133 [Bipolaris oryzae ATCC 44560]
MERPAANGQPMAGSIGAGGRRCWWSRWPASNTLTCIPRRQGGHLLMQLHRAQNDVPSAWGGGCEPAARVTIAMAQHVRGSGEQAGGGGRCCRVNDAYPPAAPLPMPMPSASQPAFAADVVTATVVFGLGDRCAKVTLIAAPQLRIAVLVCCHCYLYLHHPMAPARRHLPKRLTLPWATCRGRQQLNGRGGTIFFSRMANGPEVTVVDIAIRLRFVGYAS